MKLVFIQILSKHRIDAVSQQGRIKHLFDMPEHETCKKNMDIFKKVHLSF